MAKKVSFLVTISVFCALEISWSYDFCQIFETLDVGVKKIGQTKIIRFVSTI